MSASTSSAGNFSEAAVKNENKSQVVAPNGSNPTSIQTTSPNSDTNQLSNTNGALVEGELKSNQGSSVGDGELKEANSSMNGQEEKRVETPHREVPGLLPLQPLQALPVASALTQSSLTSITTSLQTMLHLLFRPHHQ